MDIIGTKCCKPDAILVIQYPINSEKHLSKSRTMMPTTEADGSLSSFLDLPTSDGPYKILASEASIKHSDKK